VTLAWQRGSALPFLAVLAAAPLLATSCSSSTQPTGRTASSCTPRQPPSTPTPYPLPTEKVPPTPRPDLALPPATPKHDPWLVPDDMHLQAPRIFGVLPRPEPVQSVQFSCYVLTADTPPPQTELPVWRLRNPNFDQASVAAVFHTGPPLQDGDRFVGAGEPTVRNWWVGWEGDLRLGLPPQTDSDAQAEVDAFFRTSGFIPASWTGPTVTSGYTYNGVYQAFMKQWRLEYRHLPIYGGVAIQSPDDSPNHGGIGGSVVLRGDGAMITFSLTAPSIDGGSMYRLRDWHQAWNDVAHGRWVAEAGNYHYGLSGHPFVADDMSLVYVPANTSSVTRRGIPVLVPMFQFTDTAKGLSLQVPALTDDEQSGA
jgi:hypothetical protein